MVSLGMYEDNYIAILTYLKDLGLIQTYSIKIDGIDLGSIKETLSELEAKELVKTFIGTVGITEKGKQYLKLQESGKLPKNEPLIHIGHNIQGNVYDSDLSMDMSRDKQITNNKTDSHKTKKSLLEWAAIIIGIVAGIIGIYWFFTK